MSKVEKYSEIPEKISSHNIFLLQDLDKELEKEWHSKESKNVYQQFLLQTIFNLLNSQITLIFQLSKLNIDTTGKSSDSHLIQHILTFNKDYMSKQIQKIISFINNNKIPKKSNISKKISNNSFLNNTSNKIPTKNKLQIKHNKNITIDNIIDNNLTKQIIGNCKTEQNENIKNA